MEPGGKGDWWNGFVDRGGSWVVVQFLVILLAIFIPQWTGRDDLQIDTVLQGLGVALTAVGSAFAAVGLASLGRSLSPFPKPVARSELHTRGVYALVRHPVYTGMIAATAGWSLWCQSLVGLGYCALMTVFLDRKAALEERWLAERFPGYLDYCRRVRRFVPWIY